ncbi:MAG: hypothetical protein KAI24_02885, partial [Planctomycetes bacterium]|nr:hypothetical protein [Planctomycetota bacterium]
MTPVLIRVVAAASLCAALAPAQEHEVVREVRETNKSKSAEHSKRHAHLLEIIEKLGNEKLSAAERKQAKAHLLELVGSVEMGKGVKLKARPIVTKLRKADGDDVEVTVEVVDGDGKPVEARVLRINEPQTWRVGGIGQVNEVVGVVSPECTRAEVVGVVVDTAVPQGKAKKAKQGQSQKARIVEVERGDLGERAKRLRVRLDGGDAFDARAEKGGDDSGRKVVRYRTLEDAKRAFERAHEAHDRAIAEYEKAHRSHDGYHVFRGKDAGDVLFLKKHAQDPHKAKAKAKSKSKDKADGGKGTFYFEVDGDMPFGGAKAKGKGKAKAKRKGAVLFDDLGDHPFGKGEGRKFVFETEGGAKFDLEAMKKRFAEMHGDFDGFGEFEFDVVVEGDAEAAEGKARRWAMRSGDAENEFRLLLPGKAKAKAKGEKPGGNVFRWVHEGHGEHGEHRGHGEHREHGEHGEHGEHR